MKQGKSLAQTTVNTRRQFLKQAGAASAVLSTLGSPLLGQKAVRPAAPKKTVRVGFVGVGAELTAIKQELPGSNRVEISQDEAELYLYLYLALVWGVLGSPHIALGFHRWEGHEHPRGEQAPDA